MHVSVQKVLQVLCFACTSTMNVTLSFPIAQLFLCTTGEVSASLCRCLLSPLPHARTCLVKSPAPSCNCCSPSAFPPWVCQVFILSSSNQGHCQAPGSCAINVCKINAVHVPDSQKLIMKPEAGTWNFLLVYDSCRSVFLNSYFAVFKAETQVVTTHFQ